MSLLLSTTVVKSNLIPSPGTSHVSFSPAYLHRSPRPSSSKETLVIPPYSASSSCDWRATDDRSIGAATRRNAESHIHICPYGYQSSKNDCSSRLVGIAMLWDTQKFRQHERCIGTSVYVIMKQILCVKPFDVILFVGTTLCNPLCLNLCLVLCLPSAFNQFLTTFSSVTTTSNYVTIS